METQLVRGLRVAAIETFAGLGMGFLLGLISFVIIIVVKSVVS